MRSEQELMSIAREAIISELNILNWQDGLNWQAEEEQLSREEKERVDELCMKLVDQLIKSLDEERGE
jgi:predicted CoA-binding protein